MKLTKTQLKQIIQEELQKVLQEQQSWAPAPARTTGPLTQRGMLATFGPEAASPDVQRRNAAKVQQQRNKAKQARLMARARKIAEENPGISFEQAVERARGSVEVATAPVEASTSMTAEEYERIHGKGSVKAANPRPDQPEESITVDEYERTHGKGSASSNYADCPQGQKPIGQRNDGSPICG